MTTPTTLRWKLRRAYLLLAAGLLLTSCEQSGRWEKQREYPPFTLRVTSSWTQALWGPRVEARRYTFSYRGKPLRFPGVADQQGAFPWCEPLPGGRFLLATCCDTLAPGHVQAGFRVYQLRATASGPYLDRLGPSCPANVLIPGEPAYWLTPDSVGLLLPTPDSLGLLEAATYRFVDLRRPNISTAVPPPPLTPDGLRREIGRVYCSANGQELIRTYHLPDTFAELEEHIDVQTGRRWFQHRPAPTATTANVPADSAQLLTE